MASSEPRWHPEAYLDAEEARNWYAERSPLAARGFLLALEEALEAVIESPTRWPPAKYGCRRYVFPTHYPYSLIYMFTPVVRIVAVAHQSRHPEYWRHRLGSAE